MNWHSASEFLEMGGYAPYVWSSVLACAACVAGELALLRARRRAVLASLRRQCEVREIENGEHAQRMAPQPRLAHKAAA